MVNFSWKSFSASVRGPGHARLCLPNQDACMVSSRIWGDVAVVSDGVGSCSHSEYGSSAACSAVISAAENWIIQNCTIDSFFDEVHRIWLSNIKPFDPDECSATCLFSICPKDGEILLGMLGDGLIAIIKSDGSYTELYDEKDGAFSNQTCALSSKTQTSQWRMISMNQDECCAILLCTDGIADDLLPEKRQDFVRHIYNQGQSFATATVARELRKMLEQWPVPKHSDDKTLVCLYKNQESQ